jgi:serine/threonine protein kinase
VEAKRWLKQIQDLPCHATLAPLGEIENAGPWHYLAWQHAPGDSLQDRIYRRGPLAPRETCDFFAELADGLAICHQHQVFHGSLKASHVAWSDQGRPKLRALGLMAIVWDNLNKEESLLDTSTRRLAIQDLLENAPPEFSATGGQLTPQADIYAFGCLMYFALTGVPHLAGSGFLARADAQLKNQTTPISQWNPELPGVLATLVEECLQQDPANRPGDFWQIRDVLRTIRETFPEKLVEFRSIDSQRMSEFEGLGSTEDLGIEAKRDTEEDPEGAIDFDFIPPEEWAQSSQHPSYRTQPQINIVIHENEELPELKAPDDVPLLAPPPPPKRLRLVEEQQKFPRPAASTHNALLKPKTLSIDLPPTPLNWNDKTPSDSALKQERQRVTVPPLPNFAHSLTRSVGKMFRFFSHPTDVVQLSIFGLPMVTPGQQCAIKVYAHPPAAFRSVTTLCRALHQDWELIGAGYADRPIRRGSKLHFQLWLASAGVAKSQVEFTWIGQTQPRVFEIFVPWECPSGLTTGQLTIMNDAQESGKIDLQLLVSPRSSERNSS